jgi:hypothetical protein
MLRKRRQRFFLAVAVASFMGVAGCNLAAPSPSSPPVAKQNADPKIAPDETVRPFMESLKDALAKGDRARVEELLPAGVVFTTWEHHGEGQRGPVAIRQIQREEAISKVMTSFNRTDLRSYQGVEKGAQQVLLDYNSADHWNHSLKVTVERTAAGPWRAVSADLSDHLLATR